MLEDKVAVIGERESVLAFKAAGVDVFSPLDSHETEELIKKLSRQSYAIIFITEEKAEGVSKLILDYKSKTYPIILPIPSSSGSKGLGMRGLKYNIEKAIGMDIMFNKGEEV